MHVAFPVPLEVERRRLVLPFDLVEVEELRELALAGVGEADGVALAEFVGAGRLSRSRASGLPLRPAFRVARAPLEVVPHLVQCDREDALTLA